MSTMTNLFHIQITLAPMAIVRMNMVMKFSKFKFHKLYIVIFFIIILTEFIDLVYHMAHRSYCMLCGYTAHRSYYMLCMLMYGESNLNRTNDNTSGLFCLYL